ncbi:hypothetical protein [Paludisphaera sp.]|uniref:hypothetical protein n=1 Tax=Paludisphaera sp. TaxID=2017432 RepID=UPI00301D7B2C
MTPRRARISLFAAPVWAALSAATLAFAWSADARASCGGLAHPAEAVGVAASTFSAEIVGDEPTSPLKPPGCTGAFCARTDGPAGMDFTGGVDLRAESWACAPTPVDPGPDGGARLVARSDALSPGTGGDDLLDPPR